MDFNQVRTRIETLVRARQLALMLTLRTQPVYGVWEFYRDMLLIFTNALTYNEPVRLAPAGVAHSRLGVARLHSGGADEARTREGNGAYDGGSAGADLGPHRGRARGSYTAESARQGGAALARRVNCVSLCRRGAERVHRYLWRSSRGRVRSPRGDRRTLSCAPRLPKSPDLQGAPPPVGNAEGRGGRRVRGGVSGTITHNLGLCDSSRFGARAFFEKSKAARTVLGRRPGGS